MGSLIIVDIDPIINLLHAYLLKIIVIMAMLEPGPNFRGKYSNFQPCAFPKIRNSQ